MHPNTFYSNYFQHEKRDEIFVIMSFAPGFEARWRNIIEPGIREDVGLKPVRVDYRKTGETVIHDILDGIAHSKLVLAEITSTAMTDRSGEEWPQRNANVMWELGIAHTMRLPDEVLIYRTDTDDTIFDLTQFKVHDYDPTDEIQSREEISFMVKDRLRSLDLSKSHYVKLCVESLGPTEATFLMMHVSYDGSPNFYRPTLMTSAPLSRLHQLGLVKTIRYMPSTTQTGDSTLSGGVCITNLGKLVVDQLNIRF